MAITNFMKYPKGFFEVNLRFAQKVAELSEQPLENTLLHYTNLYIRFGLGRDFASANPIWKEYLEGIRQTEDMCEWTYRFYFKQKEQNAPIPISPFGCFSYTVLNENRIRLHFHNNELAGYSPLSKSRIAIRLIELTAMFAHIKKSVSNPTSVIGASWLYNIEAYRRLFPPKYLKTAQVQGKEFPFLPLWGQFVDHCGLIKEDIAGLFLERLNQQQSLDDIENCFPFRVFYLESMIQEFYKFYGC